MAINFPTTPFVGQIYSEPQTPNSWQWDGEKWINVESGNATGAVIQTPVVTDPTDPIDPNVNLTLDSSAYQIVSGIPGNHASSYWQVSAGTVPIVSTNQITAVDEVDAAWTQTDLEAAGDGGQGDLVAPVDVDNQVAVIVGFRQNNNSNPSQYSEYCYYTLDGGTTWQNNTTFFCNGSTGGKLQTSRVRYMSGWWFSWFGGKKSDGGTANGFAYARNPNDTWSQRYVNTDTFNGGNFVGVFGAWGFFRGGNVSNSWLDLVNGPSQPSSVNFSHNFGSNDGNRWACMGSNNTNAIIQTDQAGCFWHNATGNPLSGWTPHDISADNPNFRPSRIEWVPRLSLFIAIGNNAQVWSSPNALTWTFVNTGFTSETVTEVVDDGVNLIISAETSLVYSSDPNLEVWSAVSYFSIDGTERVKGWTDRYLSNDTSVRSNPVNYRETGAFIPTVNLTIAGAQTDGFAAGFDVVNRGGLSASGTISGLDDTEVTLVGSDGNWTVGSRIATNPNDFNLIVDGESDTDLTSITVDSDLLEDNQTFQARVRYRSDGNVVSNFSDWTEFNS